MSTTILRNTGGGREPKWRTTFNLFPLEKPKIDFSAVLAKLDAEWLQSELRFHDNGNLVFIGAGTNFNTNNFREQDAPASSGDFLISTVTKEAAR